MSFYGQLTTLNDFKNSKIVKLPKYTNEKNYQKSIKILQVKPELTNENKNIKIFVYGTIIDPKIRDSILLNHDHKITKAILKGYEIGFIKIGNENFKTIIENKQSQIIGNIIEVSLNELEILDTYETSYYLRKQLKSKNGVKIWVYQSAEKKIVSDF